MTKSRDTSSSTKKSYRKPTDYQRIITLFNEL